MKAPAHWSAPPDKPGLLAHFATSFAQGFQPKHFLGKFHPDISADADSYAQSLGFENGLAETILQVERNTERTIFETPQTVSWERVSNKLPEILYDI